MLHRWRRTKVVARRRLPQTCLWWMKGTTNSDVRALFAQYRERFARTDLPGILLGFATNPALLKGMLEIAENFVFCESLVGRRHKEMIATYVFTSRSEFDPFRSRFTHNRRCAH
jgi:hypothetical protein